MLREVLVGQERDNGEDTVGYTVLDIEMLAQEGANVSYFYQHSHILSVRCDL